MHVTFYGAAQEVTGSMHLLSTETDRVLLDCGMFQGRRKETDRKNRVLPFDPGILNHVILSHAHIDHSGRIPLLAAEGFSGRVVCTRPTADACEYLLLDSAHIQESDANYLNYKTLRSALSKMKSFPDSKALDPEEMRRIKALLKKDRHDLDLERINALIADYHIEAVTPLYTTEMARQSLGFFDPYPYRHPFGVGRETVCTFYEAGHILGSAISVIRASERGRQYRIGYTGDLGRFGKPILRDPAVDFAPADRELDLLILESTYGDRFHPPAADMKAALAETVRSTVEAGGSVIIPAFAFGRTQELIYLLHQLYDEKAVPRVPIWIDSPLAIRLTRVFGEHPEVYDQEAHHTFLEKGKNPFAFPQVRFSQTVAESMALMQESAPQIVIAASGMCEAGRILHHLRYRVHNPKNTILIVGYMAKHTLGRRILDLGTSADEADKSQAPPRVRILNKEYPLKARVVKLGGFSAHADKGEILAFLKKANLNIKRIAVVHGEKEQSLAFARSLKNAGYDPFVPQAGETVGIS